MRVAQGEIYAFLGLNGAGKTTTIRMLLGMVKPTSGEARVLGLAGKRTEAAALYRLILKETPETPLRDLVEIQLAQTE